MILRALNVTNYRNIMSASLTLSPKLNYLTGRNGAGKTNILDAVWLLSFCKSAQSATDTQLITHGKEYFAVDGRYVREDGEEFRVRCSLKQGGKKRMRIGEKDYRRLSDHIGLIPVVYVSPSDIFLIEGGSEGRRRLMDTTIAQYDRPYLAAIGRYNKALQQRNALLRTASEGGQWSTDTLDILEEMMATEGETIYARRKSFVTDITPLFKECYAGITNGKESAGLDYVSHCSRGSLIDVIRHDRQKDIAVGYSLHGVHRDDLIFTLFGHSIRQEGSQGQSKTYVAALKLAQYALLRRASGTAPLLLLDDIFDKLDAERVKEIINIVSGDGFGQIIITDTGRSRIDGMLASSGGDYKTFAVDAGTVREEEHV